MLNTILLYFITFISFINSGEIKLITLPKYEDSKDSPITINDDIYFLEFNQAVNEEECIQQHEQLKNLVNENNIEWLIRREFCLLFNGISFHGKEEAIHKIVSFPTVKAIWPMLSKRLPQYTLNDDDKISDPIDNYKLTGVHNTQNKLKLDGSGIKIGIIDTGIDYLHPYLGGCFKGPNCKVQYGKDLVGDDYDGSNTPLPDEDPRDTCGGHGTHVAGIIAADGKDFKGVAPNVTLGAYKVFGCGSNARVESDIIIEAMELAYKDGMDIINLSLGGGSAWSEYPDSVVADKLSSLGVIIVAAAGNDGDKGLFEVASPAIGNNVISVASFDSERYVARALTMDHLPLSKIDYTLAPNSSKFNFSNTNIVVSKNKEMLACDKNEELENANIKGSILIAKRGKCPFEVKALIAQELGAIGLIVINNNPGIFTPLIKDDVKDKLKIPILGLTSSNGNLVLNQMNRTEGVQVSTPPYFVNSNGGKISSFSSWGPGPELELKPDLGAPGGLIFSTFPIPLGMYATLSGTSMATPYTSGMIALYYEHYRKSNLSKLDTQELKVKLYNNAQPKKTSLNGTVFPVLRQGAGLMNIYNTVLSETKLFPSKLILNNTQLVSKGDNDTNKSIYKYIQIENSSKSQSYSYELSHLGSPTITNYENEKYLDTPKENVDAQATINFNQTKFDLNPLEKKIIQVEILMPNNLKMNDFNLLSGYIKVSHNQSEVDPYHIPYLASFGNYSRLPILNTKEYPKLIFHRDEKEFNSTNLNDINNNLQVSFKKSDNITLKVRIEHPTKMLYIKAINPLTQEEMGYIKGGINNYIGRNDQKANNLYYNFPFNGVLLIPKKNLTSDSNKLSKQQSDSYESSIVYENIADEEDSGNYETKSIVDGQFVFKILALKPFGNPQNKDDFQTWFSPIINVSKMNLSEI
ncbi:subtilisin-like protein [Neoconidiobolus thromboides FSU 785]|nr:subtilisin-like protein [Neoconidiobolus thromboides FSU 785]